MSLKAFKGSRSARAAVVGVAATTALLATGCSHSSSADKANIHKGAKAKVKVALILKEETNPYFVFMEHAAQAEANKLGVQLTVTAGNSDSDTSDQINQIQDAVSAGDQGIVITTDGDAVNSALDQAKKAGLLVVALDTAPIPESTADITYATNNVDAGKLVGRWAAAKVGGQNLTIALLDDVNTEVLSVDVDRDHGFLEGMGIPVGNPNINGKEPMSGHYSGGKGGHYTIACQEPTEGTTSMAQSALQTCLSKSPNINLVYAINEPAAEGAVKALQAANHKAVVVGIDGGCANLPYVADGSIGATAGQFPGKMSALGIEAVYNFVKKGTKPVTSAGLSYYDTGTKLYTDDPQTGVPSISTTAAKKICWG